jgi:hypothetical protein
MSKEAVVTIRLSFDQLDLGFMLGKPVSDAEFEAEVINQTYEDLYTYLRSEPINMWAEIDIKENNA